MQIFLLCFLLLAALKVHDLHGKEVMFKDFVSALQSGGIDIFMIPLHDKEKFIGALSRSPKVSIVNILLFLSLYRCWSNDSKVTVIPKKGKSIALSKNSNYCLSLCLTNNNLINKIFDLLHVLMQEISAYRCDNAITEIIFNSSLKLCGAVLSPADMRHLWLHIVKSSGFVIADEGIHSESGISAASVTFNEILLFFNPVIDTAVSASNGRQHLNIPPSSVSLSITSPIPAAIVGETSIPLQKKSEKHQTSSLIFNDAPEELSDNSISLPVQCKPVRFEHSLASSRGILGLTNKGTCECNIQIRVESHLNDMTIENKDGFSRLLFCKSKSTIDFALSHTDLLDSLFKFGVHLNQREREEFWTAALSDCSLQFTTEMNGPKDATIDEFLQWICFTLLLTRSGKAPDKKILETFEFLD